MLHQQAPDTILDTFDSERATFAHTLLHMTDTVFDFATTEGQFANFMRTHIAPNLVKIAWQFDMPKEKIFDILSQIKVNYRDSQLSLGKAGKIHGDDRLPYVKITTGDQADNFNDFDGIVWQVHVYGEPSLELVDWCKRQGLKLVTFAWQEYFIQAGFSKNAVYLIRPESYVAVAVVDNAVAVLDIYVKTHKLSFNAAVNYD